MSILLTATFDTRRNADMAIERLVQEFDVDRTTIFVATEGDSNSAGEESDGADAGDATSAGDAALAGAIVVSVTVADEAAAEQVRSAYDEFAAAGVVETDPARV